MTSKYVGNDRGQTLPLFIWLTVFLLFVALAFFVFAQAASARNGAQSAADAAALAAAQEARDELVLDLGDVIGEDVDWLDWLDLPGEALPIGGAEAAARQLAADNDSTVETFQSRVVDGHPGFRVDVRTNYAVGDSIIPGTESMQARADATAVIQPRCEFELDAEPLQPVELSCDGESMTIDPKAFDPDDLPDASVMFSVRLAE